MLLRLVTTPLFHLHTSCIHPRKQLSQYLHKILRVFFHKIGPFGPFGDISYEFNTLQKHKLGTYWGHESRTGDTRNNSKTLCSRSTVLVLVPSFFAVSSADFLESPLAPTGAFGSYCPVAGSRSPPRSFLSSNISTYRNFFSGVRVRRVTWRRIALSIASEEDVHRARR